MRTGWAWRRQWKFASIGLPSAGVAEAVYKYNPLWRSFVYGGRLSCPASESGPRICLGYQGDLNHKLAGLAWLWLPDMGLSEHLPGYLRAWCRMHGNHLVVGTVLVVHRGLFLWSLASGRSARPLWARLGPGGSSHGECPTPCGSHHAEPCGSHCPAARLRPPGFPPPQGKFRKPGVARCFGRFGIRGCSFY